MNWILFAIIGAACGWVTAGPGSDKKGAEVLGSMAVGAIAAIVLAFLVGFVFSALFLLVKIAFVVFGVLVLLALLGAGKSD